MSADIYLEAADCCSAHDHNITHNVAPMLREAGLDWRDYQTTPPLTAAYLQGEITDALTRMAHDPDRFRSMSAPNGWGTFEQTVPFLMRLFLDCAIHPDAIVRVSL